MNKVKDIFMYAVASAVTICIFLVVYLLATKPIPTENKEMFYVIIVSLVGFEGIIINYFFGSSRGSAEKSEIIKNL